MAKKKNVVPFKAINDVIKSEYRNENIVTWHDIDIIVKRRISIEDMSAFVSQVAEACFDEGGDYHPEFRELLFKSGVLTFFTNINLPENSADQFDLIYSDDLYSEIERGIDEELLYDIDVAVNKKIDYLIKMRVEAINKRTIEMFNSFDGIMSDLENIGSMISDEELKKLIDVLSSDKFSINENAIAEAIVNMRK